MPSGAVAVVDKAPGGPITETEYTKALVQEQARAGLSGPAPRGSPKEEAIKSAALSRVLLGRWLEGEAARIGVTVSDSEVENRIQQVIDQQFGGSQAKFDAFIKQQHLTLAEARDQVRQQALAESIQAEITPAGADAKSQQRFLESYQRAYIRRWRARTVCAEKLATDRCSNGPPLQDSGPTTP